MGKKLKRVNNGNYSPSNPARGGIVTTLPKISPTRVTLTIWFLTIAGFFAIAADGWMSWIGFSDMPIEWYIAATLTSIVAAAQLGSGIIQSLGGNPFTGVGGSSEGDNLWGMVLRGLYALDILSNFAGFGGPKYLSLDLLKSNPGGMIGYAILNLLLSVLLAFGDELLFRLRDRVAIGAKKNEQLSKLHQIHLSAHNEAIAAYKTRAIEQGKAAGQRAKVDFDWIEEKDNV